MPPSNHIAPHANIIQRSIGDVIRRIPAHNRRQKCPGAESARRERGDVVRALGVDAAGECERAVGLDGVEGSDHGDLGGC